MEVKTKFGKHLLSKFCFDPKIININNGSFGSPPKEIIQKRRQYQEEMDSNPDSFFRFIMDEKIIETRKIISNYINADLDGLVIVQNASDGINSVFKSMLSNGDKILMFDIAYITAKQCAKFLHDRYQVDIVEVVLDEATINDDQMILDKIEKSVKENSQIKLANIDHISSVPALKLPVEKIIKLLRNYNILVFVDGAHTVGQIELDIKAIDPDFYISNFHKWGFNAKSACFLYVAEKFRNIIHPNIISSTYDQGFCQEFSYTGTQDYSSFFTIKDAIEFIQKFGDKEIMAYNLSLAEKAGQHVSALWNTDLLIKDKGKFCCMVNVRIPCGDEKTILNAVKRLYLEYNIYILTFKFNNGKYYARFSAQIFNEIEDYNYAAKIFLKLLNSKGKF
jgi:selenocysteine lyase/cysteine desulfurase